jgi:hypothetical protein
MVSNSCHLNPAGHTNGLRMIRSVRHTIASMIGIIAQPGRVT